MMILTSVYGVVDGLFISNFVGETPFAAVNLIMPLIMILGGGVGFMFGTGGTALVLKLLGEGEKERANRIFSMIILFAVCIGVVLTAVGMAIVHPVALLFGADEDMIGHCVIYGRIVIGFTTFYMLQNIFQSFLAAAEKPNLGLIVTLIAGCTNAGLDALFIAALDWGVVGAAVATGLGQAVGGIVPLVYFLRPNGSLLRLAKTRLEIRPLLKACGNGMSELLTNIATSAVSIVYNLQLMAYLGKNGVAAYGVLMYVMLVFAAVMIGFTVGSAPVIAYHYGAGNKDELKSLFKKSVVMLGITGIVMSGLAQALAVPLAALFVGYDPELFDLTVYAFRIFSFAFVFMGIDIYASGFFTALNNGLVSAILSFVRTLALQMAFAFVLPLMFGVDGIWWSITVAECGAFILSVVFFLAERKKYGYL